MSKRLTKKERDIANEFLATGNKVKSALKVQPSYSYVSASKMANVILNKPNVIEYLESHSKDAASRIVTMSIDAENESVKLKANQDILDRAGYKPVEKSVTLNINEDVIKNEELESLAKQLNDIARNNNRQNIPSDGSNPHTVHPETQD